MASLRLGCKDAGAGLRDQRLLPRSAEKPPYDRLGEGFRMPAGVRKPPKHEPAGRRRGLWGFKVLPVRGDGRVDAAVRSAGTLVSVIFWQYACG